MELILSSLFFLHPVVGAEMPFHSRRHMRHFSPSCRGTNGDHLLGSDPRIPRPTGCWMFKDGLCAVPRALSVLQCMAVYCPKDWTPAVCLDRGGPGLKDSLDDFPVTLRQNAKDLSSGNSGWVKQWLRPSDLGPAVDRLGQESTRGEGDSQVVWLCISLFLQ